MSFKGDFFKNTFQLASFNYITEVVSFLASIVLARLLLPEEFGLVAMIYVLSNFASIFSGAGFGADIIRKDFGYTYHKGMINMSFYLGLGLFAIIMALAYPLALFYENKALIVPTMLISLVFLVKSTASAYYALLQKKMDFNYLGKVQLFSQLFSALLMIAMAAMGFSYWSLIIPVIISEYIRFGAYLNRTKLTFKIHPFKYTVVAFRESKSIMSAVLGKKTIYYWSSNLDNMLIGKKYGEAKLGIYNRAYRFITLTFNLINRVFNSVLFPSLKKQQDDRGNIKKEFLGLMGLLCIISYPIGLVLILVPREFVLILWGNNWLEVAGLLPYFGLYILFLPMRDSLGTLFQLLHKERMMFYLGVVSSAILILAIIGGLQISVIAVAQFIVLSNILLILPTEIHYGFYKSFHYTYKEIIKFWGPKILLYIAIFVSVWQDQLLYTIAGMILYLAHLIFNQKEIIFTTIKTIQKGRSKKN